MTAFNRAWVLIKASMYFGEKDPYGLRQASKEGHEWVDDDMIEYANNARVKGQMGSIALPDNWDPMESWGSPVSGENQPFRGINLSEYGDRERRGQFRHNRANLSEDQEQGMIEHMEQTATHEATHEAQRQPLREAWQEETGARKKRGLPEVSEEQMRGWDEYGAIAAQVGSEPNPLFYGNLSAQEATQRVAMIHPVFQASPQGVKIQERQQPIQRSESMVFDEAWGLLKDFRYNRGFPGILEQGGYEPTSDTPYVNLASHTAGFRGASDSKLIDKITQILGHEHMHQALHPPYTDDLWDTVSMMGLSPKDVDEDEKRRLQAKVDDDWMRFQEYGAWSGTPNIDEDEKWDMLSLYGIYPKGDVE